jgi:hypothetical protein
VQRRGFGIAIVLLLLGFLADGWRCVGDEPTANVQGTVVIDGTVPAPMEWELEDSLQRVTRENVYREETWLVGENKGLANCVITLRSKNSENRVAPSSGEKTFLDKVGVRYVPHVLVITPDTPVVLRNKESPCRGFKTSGSPRLDNDFNFLIPEGTERQVTFAAQTFAPSPARSGRIPKDMLSSWTRRTLPSPTRRDISRFEERPPASIRFPSGTKLPASGPRPPDRPR